MVYTNLRAVEKQLHGLFESSKLLSTDVGDIYDAIVRDADDKEIAVDNGVAISVGDYTGNGLQERYATIAGVGDKIAVTGAPADVKTALTTEQKQAYNYTNAAGSPVKAYQIQDVDVHKDIFAIASYQFTDDSTDAVKVGAYVVVDGNGAWVAQAEKPEASTYGFIGKIHSFAVGTYYTLVRIEVVQNKQIA
jgi:hypothetical protein